MRWSGIAERLASAEQPIDLLVNNAGFGIRAKLTAADTAPHEHAIDVMIRAVLMLSAAAGRAMRQRGAGTIINVSSTAGFVAMGSYSAIKSWVTSYTEGLANELHGTGVTSHRTVSGLGAYRIPRARGHQHQLDPASFSGWTPTGLVADCLDDAAAGKVISIPSKRFKVLMAICKHLPDRTVRAVSRKLTSSRH